MTIIRPDQLFTSADELIRFAGGQQVALRRAVSAAYYGLFHTATIAVADYIVGASRRAAPEWSLAARSVAHDDLREVCGAIEKPNLPQKYKKYATGMSFGPDLKSYCRAVVEFREKRNQADYDHSAPFKTLDVKNIVATARSAHMKFRGIVDDEKRIFVCFLIFRPRH